MRQTWRLGYCDVVAGAAFPVYLSIQDSTDDYVAALARLRALDDAAFAMLVPTRRLMDGSIALVEQRPIDLVVLEDLIVVTAPNALSCGARPEIVFAKAWKATMPTEGTGEKDRAWVLPADARWEDMRFEFEATEMIRVTFRKETRKFEPVDLKMRDDRKKRPNLSYS
jgi:hypothetical protein